MNTRVLPRLTIVIATFQSGKILPKVLESVRKQTLPADQLEVLIVDGGSTDNTRELAKKYHCRWIDNPRTEPVYAKFLGYHEAKGQYLLYLDHDEVIENKLSLEKKLKVFDDQPQVKAVIGSGYKNPKGCAFINNFINEFGDPFSFFIYRLSKDDRFFFQEMKKRYPCVRENKDYAVFDFQKVSVLPIIELCAAGSIVDAHYMKKNFPETLSKPELIPHFFYLLQFRSSQLGMTKNDALLHYSSDTLKKYFNKIKWRVKNNIYHTKDMGMSGFGGREKFLPFSMKLKKFLFLPYAYSLILPTLDAVYLVVTRKDMRYFVHVPLIIYTANLIVYHLALKVCGVTLQLKSYDESKVVSRV